MTVCDYLSHDNIQAGGSPYYAKSVYSVKSILYLFAD